MKASDLQIGDWVLLDNSTPDKIKLIAKYYVVLEENCYCESALDDIKPIPLTEGILKANFTLWHKTEYRKEYEYDKEDGYVNVTMRPSHFSLHVMVGNDEFNLHMKVSFVHELQRILRCCGLLDLADNFKI